MSSGGRDRRGRNNNNDNPRSSCPHNVYIKGLCGNCGVRLDPSQSTNSVSMIHSVPDLKVSHDLAREIGKDDQLRLIKDRKLVLLVDLDQTLLHTTHEDIKDDPNVESFTLWPGHPTYHTKLRPHLKLFLDEMFTMYELHIFTFGCRKYAHKIASLIDPSQKYFGNRILSRDESVDQFSKKGNLNNLFPCGDAMVCIIDDRSDVWQNAGNLIQVKPYCYFKTSISDGAAQLPDVEDEESLDREVDELEALLGLGASNTGIKTESDTSDQVEKKDHEKVDDKLNQGDKENHEKTDDKLNKPSKEEQDDDGYKSNDRIGQQVKEKQEETEDTVNQQDEETQEKNDDNEDQKEEEEEQSENNEMSDEKEELSEESECDNNDDNGSKLKKVKFSDDSIEEESIHNVDSPQIEDKDEYLLDLINILKRVYDKWYMELDEETRYLTPEEIEGIAYKLPDIKDIIRKYFRKKF